MRGPESFGGGNLQAEATHNPEVGRLLGLLETYKKVQEILSWLVEASPGADPVLTCIRRAHMHQLMQKLGLDPESPGAFAQLEDIKMGLLNRVRYPEPRIAVPEPGFFRSRIKEIISDAEQFGAPPADSYAVDGRAGIVDVSRYGHTDWATVMPRAGSKDGGEWVHGVATIMADPVAYHAAFTGLGIDPSHRAVDHMAVAEDWSIQNGRHRALAAVSLGEEYITAAGMAQWVNVGVE